MSPERLYEAVDIIGRNARLQAQLIEDILDISRIINGKLEIERFLLSASRLMGPVLNGAGPAAAARGIELVSAVPDRLPSIDSDFKRLHQVFGNLLSNAIKFTAAGGRVEVRASVEDGMVRIDIEDSGVGIAPEFLPYIFDRFRQADSRTTRRHGGLGLGLAIAAIWSSSTAVEWNRTARDPARARR